MTKEEVACLVELTIGKLKCSKSHLAKTLGLQPAAISYWLSGDRNISDENIDKIKLLISKPENISLDNYTLDCLRIVRDIPKIKADHKLYLLKALLSH
jgi:transcriptional regulator with XRE-family HTH domain